MDYKYRYKNKISIIVPVYNVEQYVSECITSIINQTYDNLEIIIVNDGSSDNSLSLCKNFSSDKRVVIIDKNNGGLSSARNVGIENANGEYITFIDSDDYFLVNDAIELLYKNLIKSEADISCAGWVSKKKRTEKIKKLKEYTREEAISHLLDSRGFRCYAWNKLYKSYLFRDIRFPEGKVFEDIRTQYELINLSNKIVFIEEPLYFYRKRRNSITNQSFSQKNFDLVEAIDYVINKTWKDYKAAYEKMVAGYLYYYMTFINRAIISKREVCEHEIKVKDLIRLNTSNIFFSDAIDFKKKIMLLLYAYATPFYKVLIREMMKIKEVALRREENLININVFSR